MLMKTRIGLKGLMVLIDLMGIIGCSKTVSSEQQAMDTVQECYDALAKGDFETFLKGRARMDSIPASFHEQLLVAYKQFVKQQEKAHQGIDHFTVTRAEMDSVNHQIQVFLMVCYADSVQEEIVVPMIEHQGKWMMK